MMQATGELKLLLTWLFRVGTRVTDTLGARLEHMDRRAATAKLKVGKTDEWHVYPLPAEVVALLPEGDEGWVFPWRSRGGADKHRRQLCGKMGITFTFNQCRHTFGTSIVNAGGNLDLLPHWRDPKSRARYGRPDLNRVRAIMELSATPKLGKIRGKR
jgi:integrase